MVSRPLYPTSPILLDKFPTVLGEKYRIIFWGNTKTVLHPIVRVDGSRTVQRRSKRLQGLFKICIEV
jgi:hypothetical protein